MKNRILISEEELIGVIKNIFESDDSLEDYDELDLQDIFISLFRKWINNKFPNKYENYPFSYLLKKHGETFVTDLGLNPQDFKDYDGDMDFSMYRLRTFIVQLLEKQKLLLPKVPIQNKITEKYKKAIDFFIQQLELPTYAQLKITEPSINKIEIKLDFDFLNFIKSEGPIPSNHTLESKFKDFFRDYLGLPIGQPIHGEVSVNVHRPVLNGQEEWIKNVLDKQLKKKIRQLPDAKNLHSIKYSMGHRKPNLKFSFKWRSSYDERRRLKTQVDELLKSMGYKNFELEI